jgi:hypothetical protein
MAAADGQAISSLQKGRVLGENRIHGFPYIIIVCNNETEIPEVI